MIKTEDQAVQFLTTMQYLYPLFHPEDDPIVIEDYNGNRVFNDSQVKYLNDRFDEVYEVLPDPCSNIIEDIRPEININMQKCAIHNLKL